MKASTWGWVLAGVGVLGVAVVALGDDTPTGPIPTKAADWLPYANKYAALNGISPALIMSFIEHESGFKGSATRFEKNKDGSQRFDKKGRPVVSRGPMQFLIGTAEIYGLPEERHEELNTNPDLAVDLGAQLLGHLHRVFDGNVYYIGAAYNGGEGGAKKAYRNGARVNNDHADQYGRTAVKLYEKWKGLV